jgi:hypothetical protein
VTSQPTSPGTPKTQASPKATPAPGQPIDITSKTPALNTLSAETYKLLSSESYGKVEKLTEEDMMLLLRSLSVQAEFSANKKERLTLVKQLLLL